jgi:hypothetical protein
MGPSPTDRGKLGSKRHLIADRKGVPLTVALTDAHVNEPKVFGEMGDATRSIKRPLGRPRKRPEKGHTDKAYNAKSAERL